MALKILHDGHGHWLTVSTVGAEDGAEVYVVCIHQLAHTRRRKSHRFCAPRNRKFNVDVQMQAGGCDCGLFAIAFATSLASGIPPGKYCSDRSKMRKHLYTCLQKGRITNFPTVKERRHHTKVKSTEEIEVYCECRMPELRNVDMVECCKCKEWYHVHFFFVPHIAITNKNTQWFCNRCRSSQ